MSEFNPNKIDFSTINGGQKYKNGDSVQADAINNAIEASAWAQALATNQPNVENIGNVGTPSVSIETLPNGTPRLKFENLKGDIGVEDIPSKKIEYIERVMLDTVPLLDGMWLKNDTLYTEKETFKRTDYIEVEPNKEYTLCVYYRDEEASKTVSNGKIFDADKNIIADLGDGTSHIITITMPENAKYIQMCVRTDATDTDLTSNGLAISAMYYQCVVDTKTLEWLRLTKENIPDGLLTGDMFKDINIEGEQIVSDAKYQFSDNNLIDGNVFVDGKYCDATGGGILSYATLSYVVVPVEENNLYAITVYDKKLSQNICMFADSASRPLHETSNKPYYTFTPTEIADNVFIVKAPKGATKVFLNVYISEQSTAIVKKAMPIQKTLEWLKITGENIDEAVVESLAYEIDKRNYNYSYKYGDSLNKPFDFSSKKLISFGDSITVGVTSPNLAVTTNSYIRLFANKFNMALDNRAYSGTCITDSDDTDRSIYKRVLGLTSNTDFIVISGGTNDYNTGKPLGNYDSTDIKTFYGALRGICEHLKTNLVSATVIFITPIPVTRDFPNAILPLSAYSNAIYEIATLYGFNVVNGGDLGLPTKSGGWANNIVADTDGCHPTEAGHALYFRNLCGKLC